MRDEVNLGPQAKARLAELTEALHELAQPLTALSFLTEMANMQRDVGTWKAALEASATETRRAMERLRLARIVAARLAGNEGDAL
jgi:hypothetical protein